MVRVAALLLVGRWLDLYLMILPPATAAGDVPRFGLWEIGLFAGAVGLVPLLFLRGIKAASPVPHKDPLLMQSLHHEQ